MRCAVTPGNRAMESAMLVSGSLPMSSALTTSTTEVASLLVAIDVSIESRMPVTTTSSSGVVICLHPARERLRCCQRAPRQLRRLRNSRRRYRGSNVPRLERMACTDLHRYSPHCVRSARYFAGSGTCSVSGSLLLKRYKVIHRPGSLEWLEMETFPLCRVESTGAAWVCQSPAAPPCRAGPGCAASM